MPLRHAVKPIARALIVAAVFATVGATLVGCGQRGPLFMPDKENPDKRR